MNNNKSTITREQIQLLQRLRKAIINIETECQNDDYFNNYMSELKLFDYEEVNDQIYEAIEGRL